MIRLSEYTEHSYTFMRVMAGLMFLFHGLQKIFGVLSTYQPPFGSQLWIGGMIEWVFGSMIVAGIQTRWAAFICSGMMAVAYIQFHWKFQFGASFFPTINKGELALLYAIVFLFIACKGAGKWSWDER